MELNDRVTQLEDEIKILKNEVQAVLLDLRESYLNQDNPFNQNTPQIISSPPIIINQPPPAAKEEPDEVVPVADSESKLTAVEEMVPEPEPTIEPELAGEPEATEEPELAAEPEPVDEPALGDEPEPDHKPESIASTQTAQEEVKRVWRPATELEPYFKSGETSCGLNGKIDLATISGLTEWVAEAVKRFGHERTEAILDITEMMGHMAPELKDILVKFINPISGEFSDRVTTQDFLSSLMELGGLLGKDNKSEIALLYMLCQENDHR